VGNVPLEWYEDYPHIGYDLDGRRVYKPVKGDEVQVKCVWGYVDVCEEATYRAMLCTDAINTDEEEF